LIDWNMVAKVAGGGFGITILVLIVLAVVAWIVGLVVQRTVKTTPKGTSDSGKG